jgi:hypothetical protein
VNNKSLFKILTCCWLFLSLCCAVAWGDGGRVVLVEQQGDCRISVFASPDPLRAGPIDVSVLVQDAATGQPIADALVNVRLVSRDKPNTTMHAIATKDAATNKLLCAALVELPEPGWWDVEVNCTAKKQDPVQFHFAMEAGQRFPRWLTVWPWFAWPFGVIVLYGIHRFLVARKPTLRPNSLTRLPCSG